jgi:hypothetical protein
MTTRLLREKLSIARRWMEYDAIITAKLLQIDGRDENADYIFIVSLKFFSSAPFIQPYCLVLSTFIAFKAPYTHSQRE